MNLLSSLNIIAGFLLVFCLFHTSLVLAGHHPKCHLIEFERCFDKLHQLKENNNSPSIYLTSKGGINKLCKIIKNDFSECVLSFINKCATPVYKELSKIVNAAVMEHIDEICDDDSPFQNEILDISSCVHEKVLSQKDYQKQCNNPFFTTVAWGEMEAYNDAKHRVRSAFDYLVDAGCCAYRRWEDCSFPIIDQKCNADARRILLKVVTQLLGGLPNHACSKQLFTSDSEICSKLPTIEQQREMINATAVESQKFSLFATIKMFLIRDNSSA